MKKKYRKVVSVGSSKKCQVIQMPLAPEERWKSFQESLHGFAMDMMRAVATELLEDELQMLCGVKHERSVSPAYRHGSQQGTIIANGQRVSISKPRARYRDGRGEVTLSRYQQMQSPDAMSESVVRRMVRGVSSRNYQEVIEAAEEGYGIKKSSVSRAFVRGTEQALKALRERNLQEQRFVAVVIDGKEYAGAQLVVALGVQEDGEKLILGLREGATENKEVVTSLLEELCERGLDSSLPTLFVLDGSKALSAAVKRVFGENAVIQRCQVHKKRNVRAHLSDEIWNDVSQRLSAAYSEPNYSIALKSLKTTQHWLARIAPDAAASLAEGLEETLTLSRLGIDGDLKKTFCTTNLIESAFSICETLSGRVKRWRDGSMRLRWCAAGLLKAEQSFRRVRGYRDIPALVGALNSRCSSDRFDSEKKAA